MEFLQKKGGNDVTRNEFLRSLMLAVTSLSPASYTCQPAGAPPPAREEEGMVQLMTQQQEPSPVPS